MRSSPCCAATHGAALNYSVLRAGPRAVLAPLYDVASSLPHDVAGEGVMHQRKVAISVGGERTFGLVGPEQWQRFFSANSLESGWGFERLRSLAQHLPDALASTFTGLAHLTDADELRPRFVNAVARSCGHALDQLDGAGR